MQNVSRPGVEHRLLLNHTVDPDSGCWRWTGTSARTLGYGRIKVDGRPQYVHRLAYELWVGPIPDGLVIDHVIARGCVHKDCIRPWHLEAVIIAENGRRRQRPP